MHAIELKTPIKTPDSDDTARIEFRRRMNASDLRAAGVSLRMSAVDLELSVEQVNIIASRCTGIPTACLDTLDAHDWLALYAEVAGFFGAPSESGGSD